MRYLPSILVGILFCVVSPVAAETNTSPRALATDTGVSAHLQGTLSALPVAGSLDKVVLVQPISLARDSWGRLFVVDAGTNEIHMLNAKGEVIRTIGATSRASLSAPISLPCDIAIDSRGTLYVCDLGMSAIHVFGPDLTYYGKISISHPTPGRPYCVAVDSKGRLLVGDYRVGGESRILIFAPVDSSAHLSNSPLITFQFNPPGDGTLIYPCGIPWDIAVDSEDRIIVAEGESSIVGDRDRIIIFDSRYDWVCTMGGKGTGSGQFLGLSNVAVGPSDFIVASDGTDKLSLFFPNGTYAGSVWGNPWLNGIRGLLVTDTGDILAAQLDGQNIAQIELDWESLHPSPTTNRPYREAQPVTETWTWGLVLLSLPVFVALKTHSRPVA